MIGAVVFDVGECLVDETREYGTWADWLGVPRHVFSAVFGAVIARGQDYRETFQVFRPGFDLDKARQQRAEDGKPEWFGEDDLYPDVRPALARLRDDGLWVGIAGNQTARAGGILRGLGLAADMIATSVRQLKSAAEHDMRVGGADLAGQAIKAGLADEVRLFLVPVVVGGGKRALPNGVRSDLELLDTQRFASGAVYLRYCLQSA